MLVFQRLVSVACLVQLLVSLPTAYSQVPTVAEIEERLVNYRRNLKTGRVFIETRLGAGTRGEFTNVKTISTFEGDRLCSWITYANHNGAKSIQTRECRNCEAPGKLTRYNEQEGVRPSLHLMNSLPAKGAQNDLIAVVFDPRLLGFLPAATQQMDGQFFHLGSLVGNPAYTFRKALASEWKGKACWQVDYSTRPNQPNVKFYIDPNQGPSIVGIEVLPIGDGPDYRQIVEVELATYGPNQVWYPKRSRLRCYAKDKLVEEEDVTVLEAEFNQPIDKEVFTLKGMQMKPGTRAIGFGGKKGKIWDGEKLVDATPAMRTIFPVSPVDATTPTGSGWRLWILGLAGLFAALAAVLLAYTRWAARRHRVQP